jgi:hypothetical protein
MSNRYLAEVWIEKLPQLSKYKLHEGENLNLFFESTERDTKNLKIVSTNEDTGFRSFGYTGNGTTPTDVVTGHIVKFEYFLMDRQKHNL